MMNLNCSFSFKKHQENIIYKSINLCFGDKWKQNKIIILIRKWQIKNKHAVMNLESWKTGHSNQKCAKFAVLTTQSIMLTRF